MPTPESCTTKLTLCPSPSAVTVTVTRPASVNFSALCTRLRRMSCSLVRSVRMPGTVGSTRHRSSTVGLRHARGSEATSCLHIVHLHFVQIDRHQPPLDPADIQRRL